MKKRIALVLLFALLLSAAGTAYAAGGADDPLISLSYVTDTFLPQVREALQRRIAQQVQTPAAVQQPTAPGLKTVAVRAGDTLKLTSGQQLVLLSGGVRLNVDRGTLLNVTAGRSSTGGDARVGNRYILCGDCAVTVTASADAVLAIPTGVTYTPNAVTTPAASGTCPFRDVKSTDWFYADVVSAWERGFVNGMTETEYAPKGTLTAAQAVKLAACMHQRWHTGSVTLTNAAGGRPWYETYVDYAKRNGILETDFQDYNGVISRGAFVVLFYNALPESEYPRINTIMDGAIPDVATDAPIAKQVYTFYMAGILTGYTADSGYREHAFGPESTISRAEVATIMNRMFDSGARKHFTMD